MCGIVGYIGDSEATPILLDGMSKLEYRGYDSAGIAVFDGEKIVLEKTVGRLDALKAQVKQKSPKGKIGIGHTRWATHGRPSDANSHPHCDETGDFIVVHNGIIENYYQLKEDLLKKGRKFTSETDTEVVAHLLADNYTDNFEAAVKKVLSMIDGSYSLVFMCKHDPDKLICTKKDNPLVIGLGTGENFIASDIPAVINHTKNNYILADGELAIVTKDKVVVQNKEGKVIDKEIFVVNWNAEAAEKGGYEHFMIKEIYEQPKSIRETMSGRILKNQDVVDLHDINWTIADLKKIKKIFIVACGTAYHAGVVGKYYLEHLAKIPVEVDIASEFRYREPLVDKDTLLIVVSQSGETSDTLAALKEGKRLGARTLAVTNVVASSIAREADQVLYTYAGPEIAVASTKAYTTQIITLLMLSIYFGQINGATNKSRLEELVRGLKKIPEQIYEILEDVESIKVFAQKYATNKDVFFLGRSLDYAVALEGSLKLKEISYIHAEAYAAGELKHGTLALIVDGVPVIVLATQEDVYDKTVSNIQEVKARGAVVIGIAKADDTSIKQYVDHTIFVPSSDKMLSPILAVLPLQLIAYYAALTLGCDVDKPRNLAKSVTVE